MDGLVPEPSLRAMRGHYGKATDHQGPACPWASGGALGLAGGLGRVEVAIISLSGWDAGRFCSHEARVQIPQGWVVDQASCPGDTL